MLRRRQKPTFDDDIFDTMAPGVFQLMQQGLSIEEAMKVAAPALQEALDESASRIAQDLVRRESRMLRQHGRLNRIFERRVRKHWGKALDRFYAIVVCAEEIGHELHGAHRERAAEEEYDPVFEALIGLQARACRVAREVHHLLSGGFPFGALAHSRTLHELAVLTILIADYGREEQHADLADRFLRHDLIARYKDAEVFQKDCDALGREPLSSEEMDWLKQQRDGLVQEYGKSYAEQYGWAAALVGKARPAFVDLEERADLSHLRWHYRQQSHEVHADATGWATNVLERDGVAYLTTDRVNFGLAEPAHLALVSLHQCTVSVVTGGMGDVLTKDLLALKAMAQLVNGAGDIFVEVEDAVLRAEERRKAPATKLWGRLRHW